MKTNRFLVNISLIMVIAATIFLSSVSKGFAQSIEDWSEPINLSNSGASINPLVVVGTDDVIRVIWIDEFDGYKYTESVDGIEWTSPKVVNFPFSPDDPSPKLEVTENGIIHVLWLDNENRLFYAQTLQANFGAPGAWRSQTRMGNNIIEYDFAAESTDRLHMSYITNNDSDNEPAGVYYRQSLNGGSSWTGRQSLFESPYFRTLSPEDAHVRISATRIAETENVYVVWDNPTLKNIFLSRSRDGGKIWDDPYEIIEIEESLGTDSPHGVEINAIDNNILLTWLIGESGVRCTQYSRWSEDGGEEWGEITKVLEGFSDCPVSVGYSNVDNGYSLSMLNIQENLSLIAWNNALWSDLQIQNELSSFLNPITSEPIIFQCQSAFVQRERIFVVGCDRGGSKDVWFTSRSLGLLDDWFPAQSAWSAPQTITNVSHEIRSVSSIADSGGNIHTVWTQASIQAGSIEPAIYYSVWDKEKWSTPTKVLINLNGMPDQLSLTIDHQGRLFLVWADRENSDLRFSWANSNRANIPQEWTVPSILPTPARLITSPDILTDAAGSIVVSYAVPLNENRGIYVVRSDDGGESWAAPVLIVDAVSANWDSVDEPKLALVNDGSLHVLLTQYSLQNGNQPVALYYSNSFDGGSTWAEPFPIVDQPAYWSELIVTYDQMLQLLWQEKNGEVTTIHNRNSFDSGFTWSSPFIVSSTNGDNAQTAPAADVHGQTHLLQFTADETVDVQEWVLGDSNWTTQGKIGLSNNPDDVNIKALTGGSTLANYLYAVAVFEYEDSNSITRNRLVNIGRMIDISNPKPSPDPAILPTIAVEVNLTDTQDIQGTPVSQPLLPSVVEPQPVVNKNTAGVIIILAVIVVTIIILRPTRAKKNK